MVLAEIFRPDNVCTLDATWFFRCVGPTVCVHARKEDLVS